MSKATDKFLIKEIKKARRMNHELEGELIASDNMLNASKSRSKKLEEDLIFLASMFERHARFSTTDNDVILHHYNGAYVWESEDEFERLDQIIWCYGKGVKSWSELDKELKG